MRLHCLVTIQVCGKGKLARGSCCTSFRQGTWLCVLNAYIKKLQWPINKCQWNFCSWHTWKNHWIISSVYKNYHRHFSHTRHEQSEQCCLPFKNWHQTYGWICCYTFSICCFCSFTLTNTQYHKCHKYPETSWTGTKTQKCLCCRLRRFM